MPTSSSIPHRDCIIVGSGHSGAQAAVGLRQFGFAGSIAMIGSEPELPYDRPAMSKEYLAGKKPFERLQLRAADFWAGRQIEVQTGRRVVGVDSAGKTVSLDDGERLTYGALVWAAGGEPRRLACPGHDLPGVFYLRSKADSDALRAALPGAERAVIVGGGFIGLEAAAVLREMGKAVTLIEATDRVLARVAAPAISSFYEDEHRRQGVEILLRSGITRVLGRDGLVSGVELDSGAEVPADLVIVGIGIVPAVAPLHEAGARGGNGIEMDEHCLTSLPDVYCIGDCALMARYGVRVESVQNATDQAMTAARAICGIAVPHDAVPWFWSNQYDLKLQTIGLNAGYDATVLRGDPASRSFSLVYLKAGVVLAIDCINAARDYVQGRKLVEGGARIDPALLADASRSLKDLVSDGAVQAGVSRSSGEAA